MIEPAEEANSWSDVLSVAAIALVPVVGGSLSVVLSEVITRWRQDRLQQFGDELLATFEAEYIVERLRRDERFGELFIRALTCVSVSWWLPKREAMGKVVRAALDGDDASLDDSEFLVRALELLDAPHFGALAQLDELIRSNEDDKRSFAAADVSGLIPPVLGTLIASGAVVQHQGYNKPHYSTSDLGERLLALVQL